MLILSKWSSMRSFWPLSLPGCPTQLFGGKAERLNPQTWTSFIEIDGSKKRTPGFNSNSIETLLDTFITELFRSLRTEIQDAVAQPAQGNHLPTEMFPKRTEEIAQTAQRITDTDPFRHNQNEKTDFFKFKKPNQPTERNTARNNNNQRNNSNVRFSDKSNNSKRDRSSSSKLSNEEKCKKCSRTDHSSRECKKCFNCGKIGNCRHECRAGRQNLNKKHTHINQATAQGTQKAFDRRDVWIQWWMTKVFS